MWDKLAAAARKGDAARAEVERMRAEVQAAHEKKVAEQLAGIVANLPGRLELAIANGQEFFDAFQWEPSQGHTPNVFDEAVSRLRVQFLEAGVQSESRTRDDDCTAIATLSIKTSTLRDAALRLDAPRF